MVGEIKIITTLTSNAKTTEKVVGGEVVMIL